jgi:hypothetical protein
MQTTSTVQTDWFTTPEMRTWLGDRQFPYESVPEMLRYIRVHFNNSDPFRIIDVGPLPQSYAHWWCHCRMGQMSDRRLPTPTYSSFEKWVQKTKIHSVHSVFALLYKWLDILSFDLLLLTDEGFREGVPRLSGQEIVFEDTGNLESRKATVLYIIAEGSSIFEERGWQPGLEYWKNDCTKYIF